MTKSYKFGPVTIDAGRRTEHGAEFDASLGSTHFRVEVSVTSEGVVAHWANPAVDESLEAAELPVRFPISDVAHGPLTLPDQRSGGWVEDPVDETTIQLFAGGSVSDWLAAAGGTTRTTCETHAPNICVTFPPSKLGVAVVAVAATRVRPVITGSTFGAPLPWDTPSKTGSRTSRVHGGAAGSGTLVAELELYDKLLDAVESATRDAGGCVEYGIVEHHFAFANVDDYRFLHDRFGHISADHPKDYTLSGYLGQLLRILSRNDQLTYLPGHGTGYWDYNSSISYWGLPRVSTDEVVTWAGYAASKGWHPMSWPAVSLLWGEKPVVDRTWTGHVGPGEAQPGVTTETLPRGTDDERFAAFADSFDAVAAFGADAERIAQRVRDNWKNGRGLPRDLGLLRGALRQADLSEADYVDALLDRMRQLV